MQHNNGRRNNNNNRNRFKNNNQNKRRFGGGGNGGFDDESQNISIQQRKNFANKRDQYLVKAKDCLSNGERVEAENYFQHADHCYRMMNLGLKDGARFDPQRMSIQNPQQQQNNFNADQHNDGQETEHGSSGGQEQDQHQPQHQQHQQNQHQQNQHQHQERRPHNQHRRRDSYQNHERREEPSDHQPSDIGSLPFLQAPIDLDDEPRIIE